METTRQDADANVVDEANLAKLIARLINAVLKELREQHRKDAEKVFAAKRALEADNGMKGGQ